MASLARRVVKSCYNATKRLSESVKNTASDYGQALEASRQYAKNKPYKFTLFCAVTCASTISLVKKPDFSSYYDEVIRYSTEVSECSEGTRNRNSHSYITDLVHQYSISSLNIVSMGVVSLVFTRANTEQCCNYSQKCNYVQPTYTELLPTLTDVGFWGKWWILPSKMINYDINDD